MKKIAAVVVTYNRKDLLLENIQSLLAQTARQEMDIIVIDNASTDGTKDSLKKHIDSENVIYLNTGENLGGAGGFQYGIRYAAEKEYKYVWVMDDDCIPSQHALEELLKWDKNLQGRYGFLSSQVRWKDNRICMMNIQRERLVKNVKDFETEKVKIVMASFVSLFVPIKVVEEVGLPIKEFFIWTDDWEYTRRISLEYPCYLINSSVVVHKSANNIGANIVSDTESRLERYKYLYRNDVYLYRREGIKGIGYEMIRLTGHIIKTAIYARSSKVRRIKTILSGTIAGLRFYPEIEFANGEKQ